MTREEVVKEFMNEGPAKLSVEVDEAGNVGMKLRGDVFKLGWMVAKAADGIFLKSGMHILWKGWITQLRRPST